MKHWLALLFVLLAGAVPPARGYAQVPEGHHSVSGQPATLSRVYNYGLDLISQGDAGSGATLYFVYDGLGSTWLLTTTSGAVTNTFAYDAFGTLIASNAAPQADYLFTGEQFDPQLGFYYLRARYLNTGTGMFWTRDTWESNQSDPLSLHKYLYGHANPVNNIDPSGNMTLTEVNVTIGQIANLSRMSLRVINVYQKASSVIDAINAIQALANIVQGGQLQPYIQNGLSQFGNAIGGQKAIESLSKNLQRLLSRSFPIWSRYLLQHGKNLKGFVIWLPNLGGLSKIRIPAGTYGKYSLTLVAGGMSKRGTSLASASKCQAFQAQLTCSKSGEWISIQCIGYEE